MLIHSGSDSFVVMKKKLLITGVSNLTDARYFAAVDADYIGFKINSFDDKYINEVSISEIMNWVEGPSLAVETSVQVEQDLESLGELEPSLVIIPPFGEFEAPKSMMTMRVHLANQNLVLDNNANYHMVDFYAESVRLTDEWISKIEELASSHTVFVKPLPLVEEVEKLLKIDSIEGVVLMGSEEEEVGLKSFEEVDDIIDLLVEEV